MFKGAQNLFRQISNFSLPSGLSTHEKARIIIVNQGVAIAMLLHVITWVGLIVSRGQWWAPPIMLVLFSGMGVYVLHYHQLFVAARFYINLFYPPVILFIIIQFGPEIRAEYAFFVFFVTAIIFHDRMRVRILLIAYLVLLFLASEYYLEHYESPQAYMVNSFDHIMAFATVSGCLTVVIAVLFRENIRYEKQAGELLHSLEENNNTLHKAYQDIERFAYITSHDLKTPLRTINSFIGLIDRDLKKGDTEHLTEYFSFVQDGTRKMNDLIQDILEYSRLDHLGQVEEDWINLAELIQSIFQAQLSNTTKTALLNINGAFSIKGNSLFYQILWQNLIENAIKYNESDPVVINIQLGCKGQNLTMSISDNGIGIAVEFHNQIFEVFKRLHNEEHYPGTGIGLAICKKVVDKLKGTIVIDSVLGEGATFIIQIPVSKWKEY